jgi:hypothetical protein
MTERAGSVANNTAPGTLAVSVSRTRDGGLIIAVRYSYEGRPPSSKKRIEMAKAMLLISAQISKPQILLALCNRG